jgi:hypothetical protein
VEHKLTDSDPAQGSSTKNRAISNPDTTRRDALARTNPIEHGLRELAANAPEEQR